MKETNEEKNRIKKEWKNISIWALSLTLVIELASFVIFPTVEPITFKMIISMFFGGFLFMFMIVAFNFQIIDDGKEFIKASIKGKIISIIIVIIFSIYMVMRIKQSIARIY